MAALDLPARTRRASAASASLAFAWRALLKIKHVPEQLGDVIGIPVLFTLMFTYLFGGALAGSPHAYLQSLLPGTLVFAVLLLTVYTGVTLNTDVSTGVLDRFRTLPLWRPAPIVGALLGDVARYLLASALVIGLGLIMGFRPAAGLTGVLGGLALVLAFAFGISWIWTTLGLLLRSPGAVMNLGFVVLFPITFMSNVFVEPSTMPGGLRAVVDANPVSHLVTAERGLMAGAASAGEIVYVLAAAAVVTLVFAPLTMRLYGRAR